MIHLRVTRDSNTQIDCLHLSITTPNSLANFNALVNRALNCWDTAPKELKDLGDMLTHGRITQDHKYLPINTKNSSDYYTDKQQVIIQEWIAVHGYDAWKEKVNNGTSHEVLKPRTETATPPTTPKEPV